MLKQTAENTIGFAEKSTKYTNENAKELSLLHHRIIRNRTEKNLAKMKKVELFKKNISKQNPG